MLLPSLVLASVLAVQETPPPAAPPPQHPSAVSAPDAKPGTTPTIEAGLAAFKKKRFAKAEAEFKKAVDEDPSSAAANFYLGYTYYKIAEPHKRLTPTKQKALE